MTAIDPSLAARIAERGVPLSADLAALDVPLPELERRIAKERFEARMDHLAELLAHPETAAKPGSRGELKEQRHWLHDADPDSTIPVFRVNLTKRPQEML
ncbi:hypothetical protein OG747_36275 [Streptomyces sp. NBC_01384]|uniref:hypothetical protein n=1 Tax=Streptomyces sp. NBC_01384 TaxID=2903847 RepID=UPI003246C0CA